MNKNIVLFGCDNSGKSTLGFGISKELKKENIKVNYVHCSAPKDKDSMIKFMEDNLSLEGVTIFDRLPILDEIVYGTILRNISLFPDELYNQKIFDRIDLFIFCNPGLFSIFNWGERDQFPGVKENALKIINKFNELALDLQKKGYKVKEYNYKCDNPKILVEDFINEYK